MHTKKLSVYWLVLHLLLGSCTSNLGKSALNSSATSRLLGDQAAPQGFVILPLSKYVLNHPNCSKVWTVLQEEGVTKIKEKSEKQTTTALPFKVDRHAANFSSKHHVHQVDDGWLISFDRGEWGGKLLWFSPDGSKTQEILYDNVRGLVKSSTGIFVITGLQHMGIPKGKIFHLRKGDRGWKAELLVNFGAMPHTFAQESPDSLLVVVGNQYNLSANESNKFVEEPGGLFRVKVSGKVEPLLMSKQLGQSQPNSMVLTKSGVIYLGAWRYVMRLTPAGDSYKEEKFVPLNCSEKTGYLTEEHTKSNLN